MAAILIGMNVRGVSAAPGKECEVKRLCANETDNCVLAFYGYDCGGVLLTPNEARQFADSLYTLADRVEKRLAEKKP